MRTGEAGQTTTEYLMISGLITAIALFFLRFVWAPPLGCGSTIQSTIQCALQSVVDVIINDPS